MICRARPKYFSNRHNINAENYLGDQGLYFNSGSYAFGFFLKCYNLFYQKRAKVAIQSFTCETMLDAILSSGSEAYLYDVCLEDASLSFDLVQNEDVDIIVLTHYQGIPNKDYLKFDTMCRQKGILLFDDLSHGTESCIGGIKIGTLSAAYVESYSFDKPYCVLNGGKLGINDLPTDFKQYLFDEYLLLPVEKSRNADRDLKMVEFLMKYTEESCYYDDFDYANFIQLPWLRFFWSRKLFQASIYRKSLWFIFEVCRRLRYPRLRTVARMNSRKKQYIEEQKRNFDCLKNARYHFDFGVDISSGFESAGTTIVWNRYSLIDYSGELIEKLYGNGICAGNFNWQIALHDSSRYKDCKKIFFRSQFQNTDILKKYVVNIPIWQFM